MKRFKIKLLTIAFVLLFPVSSFAVVPLAYFVGWSVIGHVAVLDGYLAYLVYNLMQGQKKVSTSSDIAAPAQVTWVDLTDPSVPAIKQKEVAYKITKSKIETKVTASPSSYPKLKQALDTVNAASGRDIQNPGWGWVTTEPLNNDIITYFYTGTARKITNNVSYTVTHGNGNYAGGDCSEFWYQSFSREGYTATPGSQVIFHKLCLDNTSSNGITWIKKFDVTTAGASTVTLKDVISDSSGNLKSDYDDEISRLIKSSVVQNGDVIDIKMGNGWPDGPVYSQPAAPTPAQVEAAGGISPNGSGLVSDGSTSSGSGSGSGSGSTIPEFTVIPFDRQNGFGNADPFSFGDRFQAFFNQMKSTAVFSLPNQFLSGIPTGGTSEISFDGGIYGQHSYDFSSLSPVFLILKTIILIVFAWLSIRIVLLKGAE